MLWCLGNIWNCGGQMVVAEELDNTRKIATLIIQYVNNWVLRAHFGLVPVFFSTALPRSGGLSPRGGWDAVTWRSNGIPPCNGIPNCKKEKLLISRFRYLLYGIEYGLNIGWLLAHNMSWHDYPTLIDCHGILFYRFQCVRLILFKVCFWHF